MCTFCFGLYFIFNIMSCFLSFLIYFYIQFFDYTPQHAVSQFPNQGSNLRSVQWKCGILTTGLSGKSQNYVPLCTMIKNSHKDLGGTHTHTIIIIIIISIWNFKILLIFQLKDNCFTEFCYFLSNINMNQPQVHPCPLPRETPSHLPPHPTLLDCHRAPVCVP